MTAVLSCVSSTNSVVVGHAKTTCYHAVLGGWIADILVAWSHIVVSCYHHVVVLLVDCRVVAKTVSTSTKVGLLRSCSILSIQLRTSTWLTTVLAICVVISYLLQIVVHVIRSHSIWNNSRYIKNTLCTGLELCLSIVLELSLILPRVKTLIVSKLTMTTFSRSLAMDWILLLLALSIL